MRDRGKQDDPVVRYRSQPVERNGVPHGSWVHFALLGFVARRHRTAVLIGRALSQGSALFALGYPTRLLPTQRADYSEVSNKETTVTMSLTAIALTIATAACACGAVFLPVIVRSPQSAAGFHLSPKRAQRHRSAVARATRKTFVISVGLGVAAALLGLATSLTGGGA